MQLDMARTKYLLASLHEGCWTPGCTACENAVAMLAEWSCHPSPQEVDDYRKQAHQQVQECEDCRCCLRMLQAALERLDHPDDDL